MSSPSFQSGIVKQEHTSGSAGSFCVHLCVLHAQLSSTPNFQAVGSFHVHAHLFFSLYYEFQCPEGGPINDILA